MVVYLNGDLVLLDQACIPIQEPFGRPLGDGVFDVVL